MYKGKYKGGADFIISLNFLSKNVERYNKI